MPICDRDAKWSLSVRTRLQGAGLHVIQTPYRAPNATAYAERFVRSIKEECLNRLIPLGDAIIDARSRSSAPITIAIGSNHELREHAG